MPLESAERGDEDAGGRFLADSAAAPAPLKRPFLDRTLPAEDMPEARPRRRGDAADHLDRTPHRVARRLNPQARRVALPPRSGLAEAQMRQVDGVQRVEL